MPSKYRTASRKPKKYSWHWWNQPHEVDVNIDIGGKAIILMMILLIGAVSLSYGVYTTTADYQAGQPHAPLRDPNVDPFTILWNGTIMTAGLDNAVGFIYSNEQTICASPCASTIFTAVAGDWVMVHTMCLGSNGGNPGVTSVTDSNADPFTRIVHVSVGAYSFSDVWQASFASSNALEQITVTGDVDCFGGLNFSFEIYRGVEGFGNQTVQSDSFPALSTAGFHSIGITTTKAYSIVYEIMDMFTSFSSTVDCPAQTPRSGQTNRETFDCWEPGAGTAVNGATYDKTIPILGAQGFNVSWTNPAGLTTGLLIHGVIELKMQRAFCPPGYQCVNSTIDTQSHIRVDPNATYAGIALTNSPIELATAISKELFIFETYRNMTTLNPNIGIGWYLTANKTLPGTANYNPLNDPNVVMVELVYKYPNGDQNYYIYMQRTPGQALLSGSGLGENPYPTCPQSATIFICSHYSDASGGYVNISTTLNYTGSGGPNANNGQSSFSLLCGGTNPTAPLGGQCTTATGSSPCSGTPLCGTNAFPWLNIQSGAYYLGFWAGVNQGEVRFGTAHTAGGVLFSEKANAAYYWIPNPTCPPTCSTTDTGGFFGWVARGLGAASTFIGNVVHTVSDFVTNPLGDIGNALAGALQFFLGYVFSVFAAIFDYLGGLVGLPGIGTAIINFITSTASLVASAILHFGGWVVSGVLFMVGIFQITVAIASATIITTLLLYVAGPITTLINLVLTVIALFFSYVVPASYLLAIDWIWGMFTLYLWGVSSWLGWINLNIQIFTFSFKAVWFFVNWLIDAIEFVIAHIPFIHGSKSPKPPVPSGGLSGGIGQETY